MPLHFRILLGMVAGVLFGLVCVWLDYGWFVTDWIKPFGAMFINALKMIAVPLVMASLIKGVSDMRDLSRLSALGGKTIGLYLFTTVVAVTLGLLVVNIVSPGGAIDEPTRDKLSADYQDKAIENIQRAEQAKERGPLAPLVDMVPGNLFAAASDNGSMLQVIAFVIFFGIGLILTPDDKAQPVKDFFDGMNEVILKLIDVIMLGAPYGVFALLATLVVDTPSWDVFVALIIYGLCVIAGLAVMVFVFYPMLVVAFTGRSYVSFMRGISPAQLLAFSTSSSAATLPLTMERVEEHLGVHEDVASFVLPIGATINMDGTSLYQAVAAVFIAQALGMDLTLADQIAIVLTATLASIGSAAVPGAGIVMLVIVLQSIQVPSEGIALILGVDRLLDMCRTSVNVTGDAAVSMLVAKSSGMLREPHEKHWDDYYPKKDADESMEE